MNQRQHLHSRRDCLHLGAAATLAACTIAGPSRAAQGKPEGGSQ